MTSILHLFHILEPVEPTEPTEEPTTEEPVPEGKSSKWGSLILTFNRQTCRLILVSKLSRCFVVTLLARISSWKFEMLTALTLLQDQERALLISVQQKCAWNLNITGLFSVLQKSICLSLEPLEEAKRKRAGDDGNGKGGVRSLPGLIPCALIISYSCLLLFQVGASEEERDEWTIVFIKAGTKSISAHSRMTKRTFFSC